MIAECIVFQRHARYTRELSFHIGTATEVPKSSLILYREGAILRYVGASIIIIK